MQQATDFTGRLVGYVQVGDRIPHPEKAGLSYSKWHATCTHCQRQWIISYPNLKQKTGCNCQNPLRIAEHKRMERLKAAGLR